VFPSSRGQPGPSGTTSAGDAAAGTPIASGSENLHGNAPDEANVALLLMDVINYLEFPEGEQLLRYALPMASRVLDLKRRAKAVGIPVVYVNDNFGRWRSDFTSQVEHCLKDGVRGQPLTEILLPEADDYFVLKPKHSGFFSTTLDILLEHLATKTLILTGIAGNNCVLFTANDAYMRDFALIVPRDCVAPNTEQLNRDALEQMRSVLKSDIRPSNEVVFTEADGSPPRNAVPSDPDAD
jgi:nicotinamidase-related amidase